MCNSIFLSLPTTTGSVMAERYGGSSKRVQASSGDDSIGHFIIDQEIGKGSFAQVYSGRHKTTGHLVAIKAVELARLNKKLKENLYGEIKILKSLRHPHIVALHDCLESRTHINLIMEYCELGDLSLFIKKREKLITNPATHDIARKYPNVPNSGLNEVVIRHFLAQLASALKFLREANLVHRDVKPQNLLLLPSPQFREVSKSAKRILSASQDSLTPAAGLPSLPMLKLGDFGFARVLPSTALAETLCGSPLYMAPEILRYESYNAKADLWSVGTVLYEMVTGRPPFRAGNHVELLRKIENGNDVIKFTRESIVSSNMKSLIRALLKRNPVERISFENFFSHPVVKQPIPGLVEDDVPKESRRLSRESRVVIESPALARRLSSHRRAFDAEGCEIIAPPSPRTLRSSPLATPIESKPNPFDTRDSQAEQVPISRLSYSPRYDAEDGLGIRRPGLQPATSAPGRPGVFAERRRALSNASQRGMVSDTNLHAVAMAMEAEKARSRSRGLTEKERAAQDVAFERDYVVVEKKHVEVNALADQLASESPRAGPLMRRATQHEQPTSTSGALATRNVQIAPGRKELHRRGSHDRALSSSPGAATSAISKAIQDASLRLFGIRYVPGLLGKGASPPQVYSPFPTYPTPNTPVGLIGDGRPGAPLDEDSRVAQRIEDYATRSDVVFGFAEVKFKQLVPLAPSMDYGLGGISAEAMVEDDDGLTVEAIVSVSEESLVLYVKALSLLAKCMDIAHLWWSRKSRSDSNCGNQPVRDQTRINSAVQWIRQRFNEILEKAEIVRLKLVAAQPRLPEDHPNHPSKHMQNEAPSSALGVVFSSGLSAEKLMYERAIEMSKAAAINEITTDDLPGVEISYVTAIRMLEAVLDNEDSFHKHKASGLLKNEKSAEKDPTGSEILPDDQQTVKKMIQMITKRLGNVRNKLQVIAVAEKAQQQQMAIRRRSGDMMPRSEPAS